MKTKLYKQLLVAAFALLLAVPAFADVIALHVETAPEPGFSSFYAFNQTRYERYYIYEGDSVVLNYVEGQIEQIRLEVYDRENWAFVNWTDANGNVVGTQPSATITITAPGSYWYYANFRFNPRNPGYLPMGSYDLATGTLTLYNPQNGDMMQNYFALADRYNLPSYGKEHSDFGPASNFNPLNTVRLEGYLDNSYYVNDILNNGRDNIKTMDLSGLEESMYFSTNYMVAYNDSLQAIHLPAWLNEIASYSFINPTSLRDIYLYSTTVPTLARNAIVWYDDGSAMADSMVITVHVPAEALTAYMADTTWANKFNIVPMALNTTANISIYPNVFAEGMYLQVSEVDGQATINMPLNSSQTRYDFVNLPKNHSYKAELFTSLGILMDSAIVALTADTTLYMTNRANLSALSARVFVDTAEVTNQCLISWLNTAGDQVLATGDRSPMMPENYNGKVTITPLNELAVFVNPKDTFVIYRPGHNGLWVQLEKKPMGGQDTVRVETGAVVVTVAGDVSNTIGLLYDEEGDLLAKATFEQLNIGGVFAARGLPVGCYSVVTMREGQYSTLSRLDLYSQMGLSQGTDYLLNEVCIGADSVTYVTITTLPSEPQITNFLDQNTRFYVNKNEVMVAGQLTLTAEVEFLEEYLSDISNLFYVIDIPENLQLVENSVIIGNNSVSYSFQNGQLRVGTGLANLGNPNATTLRFCVMPLAEGNFYPSASVEFNYRNQAKAQPIGNAYFASKAITLQAPSHTIQKGFTATGFAPANSVVKILSAENDTLGSGMANALGKYTIYCMFEATASRYFVVHAEASNNIISGLVSDTCSVFYDGDAAAPTEIQMTHYNQWYHRNMTILWNLNNCSTNEKYYYYYLNADFTFRVHFVGQADSVSFIAIGQDGSRTQIAASPGTAGDWWATQYIRTYKVPVRVDLVYKYNGETITYENCRSVSAIADPSGYVYEAVSSNRLEGVTAAAYMKEKEEDMPVLWDAEPYDQVNPMLTDEAGGYAWDVPTALWQVRFSKTGYQPAQTEWLPVPPPQMDVNMPLVRTSAPNVWAINAYEDNLVIEFDRYMMLEDLTSSMIDITDGSNSIEGEFMLLDKEERFKGDTVFYASKVKFVPTSNFAVNNLTINFGEIRSYAGVPMQAKTETASVVAEIKNFGQVDTLHLTVDQNTQRTFFALPQVASAGKTMVLENVGDLFSVSATSATIAANGGAMFNFTGKVPGTTELHLTIEGSDLECYVPVVVKAAPAPITVIENVQSEETVNETPEKFIRDNMLIIRLNGKCYTVTGIQVK